MQNISSGPILDPHFTQEDELVSFFFLGFLVFLAAFLGLEAFFFVFFPTSPSSVMVKPSAPFFIPDLLRYCLSYSSSSCRRDFLPVPACTRLGFGEGDSGADVVGGELDPAFFAPQLVQNVSSAPIFEPQLEQEPELVEGKLGSAFFAPQLVQNSSSAPICEPQLEQEPDPACGCPGLGRRGSGLRSLSR